MKGKAHCKNPDIPESCLWCPKCKKRFEFPPSDVPQKTPEQVGVGFHEMVAAVEAEKKMRRSGWKKFYIKISTYRTELWACNRSDADDLHPYSPSIEDYRAIDWVEVDKEFERDEPNALNSMYLAGKDTSVFDGSNLPSEGVSQLMSFPLCGVIDGSNLPSAEVSQLISYPSETTEEIDKQVRDACAKLGNFIVKTVIAHRPTNPPKDEVQNVRPI